MSTFDHPDDLPDPAGFSDWDLVSSIATLSTLNLVWPTWKAYHHLVLVGLRAEARRRGLDPGADVVPLDLSFHCPARRPVV